MRLKHVQGIRFQKVINIVFKIKSNEIKDIEQVITRLVFSFLSNKWTPIKTHTFILKGETNKKKRTL